MANETKLLSGADLGNARIINLADPTGAQDAATRAYVLARIAEINGMTPEEVQDIIGAALVAGNNIDITYNDGAGTVTIDVEALTTGDLSDFDSASDARIAAVVTGAFVSALANVDADTLGGDSKATILASALAAAQAVDLTSENVQDIVGTLLVAGNNIDLTYDDGAGTLTIDVEALTTADLSDYGTATDSRIDTRVTGAFVSALTGVDADTLGGESASTITSNATAAAVSTIVGSASAAYDTLQEIQALMEADDTQTTNMLTAIAARAQRYAETIGDGAATTYTVTHNFNSRDVVVELYEAGDDYEQVFATVKHATANTVTVTFASAPASNQYRVVVLGMP